MSLAVSKRFSRWFSGFTKTDNLHNSAEIDKIIRLDFKLPSLYLFIFMAFSSRNTDWRSIYQRKALNVFCRICLFIYFYGAYYIQFILQPEDIGID